VQSSPGVKQACNSVLNAPDGAPREKSAAPRTNFSIDRILWS
jgi:hypothetical protein